MPFVKVYRYIREKEEERKREENRGKRGGTLDTIGSGLDRVSRGIEGIVVGDILLPAVDPVGLDDLGEVGPVVGVEPEGHWALLHQLQVLVPLEQGRPRARQEGADLNHNHLVTLGEVSISVIEH